jgi:hypothetical protein
MNAEAIIRFFMTEGVLAVCMLIVIWAVAKLVTDARLAYLLTILTYIVFGGSMLIVLLRFAGVV